MFATLQLVALTLVVAVSAASPALPTDCARDYTVVSGDTCNTIGAAEKVSLFQLFHVNPEIDANCSGLSIGEDLCLGRTGQDCTDVYVVQSGDFCAKIAQTAGIPLDTLLANNGNINSACSNLGVGEVVCIAKEVIKYT
ncbi:LysM peptidoglycan-binding domain-containing protein [Phanerochaete sordida]|uniref:LysM peptidoglycan-binding domain-containing protein n=1 Tax=Phanerochaete sordida TaxID=48140 RepID=A0A9P3LKU1_9APHY|nr:LysM peptidoglycan-binding domain-containing protein [Phanerochaete sordida]